MIDPRDLRNTSVSSDDLTNRQQEVADLVSSYVSVAHEMPSSGWIARRLNISRQRAQRYLDLLGERRRRAQHS